MKTIRVFVSASEDLGEVRLAVMDLLVQLNRFFKTRSIEFVTMLPTEGPADGDFAVALYWKDFGSLPQTGFERAYEAFKEKNTPKIYVFFKDPDAGITEALKAFKDSFGDRYGHFFCHFETVDSVKFQLTAQNLSLLPGAEIKDEFKVENGEVLLGGKTVAKLENIPFAKLNAKRKSLKRQIAAAEEEVVALEADAAESPEDADMAESWREARKKRHDLKEELKQYDGFLVGAAVFFAKASAEEMDERVRKARELFEQGKVQAANHVLDLAELCASADRNLAAFKAQREVCEKDIQALLAKAEMVLVDDSMPMTARVDEACMAYEKAISTAKRIRWDDEKTAGVLFDYARLMQKQNRFQSGGKLYAEVLAIRRRLASVNAEAYEPDVAMTLNNLAVLHSDTQRLEEAEREYTEALEIRRRLALGNPDVYEPGVATTLNNLGILHSDTQRLEEAEREYTEALEIYRRLAAGSPEAYEPDVAMTLCNWALMKRKTGHEEDAQRLAELGLEIYRKCEERNPAGYGDKMKWARSIAGGEDVQ